MAEQRHLKNAPITEALIDIRVAAGEDVTAATIEASIAGSDFGYRRVGALVDRVFGARFHSTDEKYVAQFSTDGFTLSRLAPYETWEGLQAEVQRLWPIYNRAMRPRTMKRLATRFINDLKIPLKHGDDFDEFLTTPLKVNDPAFEAISGFFLRYEAVDLPTEARIVCTQLLRGSGTAEPSVIIDIDIIRQADFAVDGESAWSYLATLRTIKNRVFFNLITERCVELFQ